MVPCAELIFVVNPDSRAGRAAAAQLRAHLGSSAYRECPWVGISELEAFSPSHPPSRVIAVGGDGTVNAAASWILRSGHRSELAMVPAGTGNNLAGALGVPPTRPRAIEVALRGSGVRRIDAICYRAAAPLQAAPGSAGVRYLIQGGAWAFPARIASQYAALRRSRLFRAVAAPLGGWIYRLLAVAEVFRESVRGALGSSERLHLRAVFPDGEIDGDVIGVFVGNEPTLGGGFRPCPRAAPDDGLLDLCVVKTEERQSLSALLRDIARGRHLTRSNVEYRQSAGPVDLQFSAAAPLVADGDVWLAAPAYRLEVLPSALAMVVR